MVAGSSLVEAVRFVGWRMTERGSNHAVATLLEVLDALPDPRSVHGRRHPLGAILGLAVCAMLCGARSLYAISQWGRDQGLEVSQTLGFTRNPTPCVSTLQLVFSRCSAGWTGMLSNPPWAVAEVPGAGGGRGVGHRRQAVAGNPRGATARNASGGSLSPSAWYFGGAAGGECQEE